MDTSKYLLFIGGIDKSETIDSFTFAGPKCNIVYKNSSKVYPYNSRNVQFYKLCESIDPHKYIVSVDGEEIHQATQILDFGEYYKIVTPTSSQAYPRASVSLRENCLGKKSCFSRFSYFQSIAGAISLVAGDGFNILANQYSKIQSVSSETALASYLADTPTVKQLAPPEVLIYPFGLNQSQKKAVENAFCSQISIIQGPPGTGKTQTILNILANAVRNHKTVAVVSNNNSATHNVVEKLQKKQLDFLTAFLGSKSNKDAFLEAQSGTYPNMTGWFLSAEDLQKTKAQVKSLTKEIHQRLNDKNRIAEIDQELLSLEPESHYFNEYYQGFQCEVLESDLGLSSQKALQLWNEYETFAEIGTPPRFFTKLRIWLQYNRQALNLFLQQPPVVIPYLQKQFYIKKRAELQNERAQLENRLAKFSFDAKADMLTNVSMQLFRHELAKRYQNGTKSRPYFDNKAFYRDCAAFNEEYPVVLSTTYSIKSSLRTGHIYDYLIVDEASQVDLVTGVLALSCARNVVIVGDLKQLPNVLTEQDIRTADAYWNTSLGNAYRFTQNSLLSSAHAVWPDAPSVLLREHYRCHPKIINFCNQKFYGGQLTVMTQDHGETDALALYRTTEGNHTRGHVNQREVDVILNEVLPKLQNAGYRNIGVITPYRDQVNALKRQLPSYLDVDTVHKFQGREKDAIILTSVDNVITDFVDDFHMLNVAVSRAVKALVVVTSQNPRNDHTNYGDLARYISYNNFEVTESKTYSVFDLLYKEYAQQRQTYLKKRKRISEYDSENLMYAVLEKILQEPDFQMVGCAVHVSLSTLVKDTSLLSPEEQSYAHNPLTHTDFLLFNKIDKTPLLAIEVDGTNFHAAGSVQAERDAKKNHIFKLCNILLLRLRTDASGEKRKVETALREVLSR